VLPASFNCCRRKPPSPSGCSSPRSTFAMATRKALLSGGAKGAAGRYAGRREDAPAAFLRPRKPICRQLPTRGLPMRFPMWALSRTRRSQNAPMGSAAAVLQQRRFFFLKRILNMHFLQSGGAALLGGSKQFRPPPAPRSRRGTREKRCRVSL
jgi:hypothetical protein